MKQNRVLSLSGGGVKGVSELVVLAEIEARTGKSITELFPIITGTSVGGLIAALLTIPKEPGSHEAKYSAKEALELFKESASEIFPHKFLGGVKQLFTHKYSQKPLEKMLNEYLDGNRLSDTTSRLIIPATDLSSKGTSIKLFDSSDDYSSHIKVQDVILATTAAPTYFKSVTNMKGIDGYSNKEEVLYAYADGGLGANRPACEVLKLLKSDSNRQEQAEILDKTMVVSLNFAKDTSDTANAIPKAGSDGIIRWLSQGKLVDKIMQYNEDNATAEVRADLPGEDEFTEISLPMTKQTSSLDNASAKNIKALVEIGRKYVEEHSEQIEKLCTNLVYNLNAEEMLSIGANEDQVVVAPNIAASEDTKVLATEVSTDDQQVNECNLVTELNRSEVLIGIQECFTRIVQDIPEREELIKCFTDTISNYNNKDLGNLILNFEAKYNESLLEQQKDQQEPWLYTSCGMEASREELELEGSDYLEDSPGYAQLVM